jgi:hypothetical protein
MDAVVVIDDNIYPKQDFLNRRGGSGWIKRLLDLVSPLLETQEPTIYSLLDSNSDAIPLINPPYQAEQWKWYKTFASEALTVEFKPVICHLDTFSPASVRIIEQERQSISQWVFCEAWQLSREPFWNFGYDIYIPERERKIKEYLNKNFPVSIWSILHCVAKHRNIPNSFGYCCVSEFTEYDDQDFIFSLKYRNPVYFMGRLGRSLFSPPFRNIPIQLSPVASTDDLLQADTLPAIPPKLVHHQAPQAFSPKGGVKSTASRKPTALPLRQ